MMRTKRILAVCMAGVLMTGTLTCVSAKTLKESFSGGTTLTCLDTNVLGNTKWRKTAWAKTEGYKKEHYVRAYIGGSKKSANNACADTGRVWGKGDISCSCSCDKWFASNQIVTFPKGYAKYGKK